MGKFKIFFGAKKTVAAGWTVKSLKVYLTGAWTAKPLKAYVGGQWVTKSIKKY